MKNLGQMMKQVQDMQAKLVDIEITGAAAGGKVQVTVNGKGTVKALKIDPTLVDPAETEVLEDLIVVALNDAQTKVDAMSQGEMSKLTGGLPLPPGLKLPF